MDVLSPGPHSSTHAQDVYNFTFVKNSGHHLQNTRCERGVVLNTLHLTFTESLTVTMRNILLATPSGHWSLTLAQGHDPGGTQRPGL